MGMTCPNCGKESLEPITGQYETGVVAPDGYRETVWEEGYQCSKCGAFTDDAELGRIEREIETRCDSGD